jgi:phosphatidate cytidylyltransferase
MPELVTRLGSALALAALALAATIYSPWTFLLLVLAGGSVVLWEWNRLTRGEGFGWTVAGLLYAILPMAALVWLRSDPAFGLAAVLYLFAVTWTTDIASYAVGRLIGGAKLAPRISPNKTWSGFIGGVLAAGLVGYAFALVLGGTAPARLALISLLLALACQAGDLVESAVKRHFGIKDMSHLIPGHGGVLDRVDGLLFAALLAALVALLRGPADPAQALLVW